MAASAAKQAPPPSTDLTTIEQILGMIGKPCRECQKLGYDGVYDSKKIGRDQPSGKPFVKYECTPFHHRSSFGITLTVTKEQLLAIGKEAMDWRRTVPEYGALTEQQRSHYYKARAPFWARLYLAAEFTPPGTEAKFEGFCWICLNEVELQLKDGKIIFGCRSCASLADYG